MSVCLFEKLEDEILGVEFRFGSLIVVGGGIYCFGFVFNWLFLLKLVINNILCFIVLLWG